MEKESLEFYKWDRQNAIIIKHNTECPWSAIYFKGVVPFQQITDDGYSSDFDAFDKDKFDLEISCPMLCREYRIVVSRYEIKKINIKEIKELFDILSYIENFEKEAKDYITEAIHDYLNV